MSANDREDDFTTPNEERKRVLNEQKQEAQQVRESGQESSFPSGQGGSGGYSQPENWGNQSQDAAANQGQGGFNQANYNQPGTYSEEQEQPKRLRDGYGDTQGSGYDKDAESVDQSGAQQGYDPAHSGVRSAHNKPGRRVDAPGRDTGTSWGEDEQMGYTTDTPDRKNLAD